MSFIPNLEPIESNFEKQKIMVIENIAKMLIERKLVKKKISELISNIMHNLKQNDFCTINVDFPKENDSKIYHIILLLEQKISNVTKTSVIGDYIFKSPEEHKIIIVLDITPRAKQTINHTFPLVEVFLKKEMIFNLIDSIYVPKHILLSKTEADKVITEYGIEKKELPRIFISDPVSRYYNAKIGQIFRIIRPSETSGFSNYYRIVVKDTIAKKNK